jgi:gliding motility-associated-like protein
VPGLSEALESEDLNQILPPEFSTIDFTIYNRWGQEVYHNPYDPNAGWDGTSWGTPQDMGVYYYSIMIETAGGKVKLYKGDVTLIR